MDLAIKKDFGILSILFPEYRVYHGQVSSFLPKKSIVVSSSDLSRLSHLDIIQIKPGGVYLDDPIGITTYLESTGVNFGPGKDVLLKLDPELFWQTIKTVIITGHVPKSVDKSVSSVFMVFKTMFQSFEESYGHYKAADNHYRRVMSSLNTMMSKVTDLDNPMLSAGYRATLEANKPYLGHYQKTLINYLGTDMAEDDFLSFLYDLSDKELRR